MLSSQPAAAFTTHDVVPPPGALNFLVKHLVKSDPLESFEDPAGMGHRLIGHLARPLLDRLEQQEGLRVCVVCAAENADGMAGSLIRHLQAVLPFDRVHLACFWQDVAVASPLDIVQITKAYQEPFPEEDPTLFVVIQPVLEQSKVVSNQLSRVLTGKHSQSIWVLAPLMGAESLSRLAEEFKNHHTFSFVKMGVLSPMPSEVAALSFQAPATPALVKERRTWATRKGLGPKRPGP